MSNRQPWRVLVEEHIRTQARPVEKFGHQPRLYALTREIGQGLDYDDDVLFAAAWLHDLGVFIGHRPEEPALLEHWDNVAYAVAKTPDLLTQWNFPHEKIEAVLACIRTHQPSAAPETLEGIILRDADILEQLGAVGIARTLCKVGRDTRFATFSQAKAALRTALEELPGKVRLPSAIALAEQRIRVHTLFLEGLYVEAGKLLY